MSDNFKKIGIIGAGNVGASCAQRIAERGYADVVLLDIVEGLAQGKALDILESAPIVNFDNRIIGTSRFEDTANSDIVVITSGIGRKPGMSRDELLRTNANIVGEVTRQIVNYSPGGIIIMVTNPVEAMTYLAILTSHFPPQRVLGLSGVLDCARFSSFIAAELNISVDNVSTCILGQHGENMVVIPRLSVVNGMPITKILSAETIDRLVRRTINAGAEIVSLLKTGSAFYAPSAAVARIVDAVMLDRKQILPCTAYLNGEYGIKDTVIGVPVKLGRKGIEQIIELELTVDERADLAASASSVQELIRSMKSGIG